MALPLTTLFPPTAGLAPFYITPSYDLVFNPNALPGAFILNSHGPPSGGISANPVTPGTYIVNPFAPRGTFILNFNAPYGTFIDDPNLPPYQVRPILNAPGVYTINSSATRGLFAGGPAGGPAAAGGPVVLVPRGYPIGVHLLHDLGAVIDMSSEPFPTWTKAVEKQVDKLLADAIKHTEALKKIREIMTRPKITAGLGKVSADIYDANPVSQTGSLFLTTCATEIRCGIWKYLQKDPDRTALALTCKSLAKEFEDYKHLRDGSVSRAQRTTRDHRLMVLIRLLTWVPRGQRLCFTCVRYCPRNKGGQWGGDENYERAAIFHDSNGRNGKNYFPKTSFKNTVPSNAAIQGSRCPTCVQRASVQTANVMTKFKQVNRMLDDHRF